jgi:Flp pilus assembly protein TadG
MLKSFKQKLRQFTSNIDGNIATLFALTAVPVLIAGGSAVDFARYDMTRQRVVAALDNAVLAAVSTLYDDEDITEQDINKAKEIALAQFNANVGDTTGLNITAPVFTYDPSSIGFTASIGGTVDNSFMQLAGINTMDLNVKTQALAGSETKVGSDLEVTMMLDTTGSMCNGSNSPCSTGTKIDALKDAAKLLVDEVVWPDQSKNTSKVALVPFADRVRLAPDGQANAAFTAATNLPAVWSGFVKGTEQQQTGETCTEWNGYYVTQGKKKTWVNTTCKTYTPTYTTVTTGVWQQNFAKARPCVTERYYNATNTFDLTDDAPGPDKWLNGDNATRQLESMDSSDTPITANGKTKPNYISPNGSNVYTTLAGNFGTSGACSTSQSTMHNNNLVMPLTNDVTALKNRISGLNADGRTSGALGTAVAWYAISPNWASVWGSDHAPQAYSKMTQLNAGGKPKLYKVAVLMTDGDYNNARGTSANVSTVNTAAKALCTNMKAKGIEIYTVGFETSSAAETLLKYCATDNSHFYSASGAAALKAAFKEIGIKVRSTAGGEVRLAR